MANETCKNLLKVCAFRPVRLEPDGSAADGADATIVTIPMLFGFTLTYPDREAFSLVNGCGDTCADTKGSPKAPDGATLRLDVCDNNAELKELILGGSLIQDVAYNTIGYQAPTDSTVNVDGTAIELWAMAWSGRQRGLLGGQPAWWRVVLPKTTWQESERVNQNQFATMSFTGVAEINSGWGVGLASDPAPVPIGEAPYQEWLVDELPAASCDYIPVVP